MQPHFSPQAVPGAPVLPAAEPEPRTISVIAAVRFAFEGEAAWTNLLWASLLYVSTQFIPLVGVIVLQGWLAEVHRRLVRRHPNSSVKFDFDDVSQYLSRGVPAFVVSFLAMLPPVVVSVSFLIAGVFVNVAGATGSAEPWVIATLVLMVLSIPLWLVLLVVVNAAMTRAELSGELGQALEPAAIWAYSRATFRVVLGKTLLLVALAVGLMLVGFLACFVGAFVAVSAIMIAHMHLRWQIYNDYLLKGGSPIGLAPHEPLKSESRSGVYGVRHP